LQLTSTASKAVATVAAVPPFAADGMVVRLPIDRLNECAADNAFFRNIGPAARPLLGI
jgi:hypothetical protein